MNNTASKVGHTQAKAQHTPGPWYYDNQDYVREISTDYCIARIFDDNAHPMPEYVENLPKQANARLIAAAPELLGALEAIVEQCSLELKEHIFYAADGCKVNVNSFKVAARAAIKRARGE